MKYEIKTAKNNDVDKLEKYELNNILDYADILSNKELDEINNYVSEKVLKKFNEYKLITIGNDIIGYFLVASYKDGYLLDGLYLEELYRNKGIGTDILQKIVLNNIVYLWVYKNNIKAFNLCKQLGFIEIESTKSRYLLKYNL